MPAITLFGAGRWGTALSTHLAASGRDVTLWARRSEVAAEMQRTRQHPTRLSDLRLPDALTITSDVETAASAADVWAIATPVPFLWEVAEQLQPHVRDDVSVVSLSKGLDPNTLHRPSQMLGEVCDALSSEQIGVLHGPGDAQEVAEKRPTTVVAAAASSEKAQTLRDTFMTSRLRVYSNTDVVGVEVGGATKNVLAIATGLSDAAGYGDNVRAALITRGLGEIRRVGRALGGQTETFSGLSGVGDLIATCTTPNNPSRFVGQRLGTGTSLDRVREELDGVAEGIPTARAVHEMATEHHLEVPIMTAVYELLFENRDPEAMIQEVITRPNKRETWLPETLQVPASKSSSSPPHASENASTE
ncbi:MAG: glycerol-3-phosphate dehydrogenase [Bacteroidetes bacterium SW_9_63_38]|nr:MAG: glycerol-3-phosphate dehydrogenase [Bacteroidetes bacterium SW_9_63_38]